MNTQGQKSRGGRSGKSGYSYLPKQQIPGAGSDGKITFTSQAKIPNHPWNGPIGTSQGNGEILLTDDKVRFFLHHGYLILKTQLPHTFHEYVYDSMESHPEYTQSGNNILPVIPCLNQVYEDPNIKGALISLLGSNYVMHPHRACHLTNPGKPSQKWHKDTFWGYVRPIRYNKIRYVMAMYYPQKTTLEMGPTGLKPGTQYYSIDPKFYKGIFPNHFENDCDSQDKMGTVESGSVILIHYDIIHKGCANLSKKNRYMFKFQFIRMDEPTQPTWNCLDRKWNGAEFSQPKDKPLESVCRSIWHWLCGGNDEKIIPLEKSELTKFVQLIEDKQEWNRFNAVYTLAARGHNEILLEYLKHNDPQLIINATYALACAVRAEELIPILRKFLKSSSIADHKISVIYIFGQLGRVAVPALDDIVPYLFDKNPNIRTYACEAVGIIGSTMPTLPDQIVENLGICLSDEEGKVRFQAVLALAQLGKNSERCIPQIVAALSDCNRYVQGYAAIALKRINTPHSMNALLEFLMATRWCPLTTPKVPF